MGDDHGTSGDRPRVLWVTDFDYPAQGREYGAEDRWLIERLRDRFDIEPVHPRDAPDAVEGAELVVVRNSGPVAGHAGAHGAFRERVAACGVPVYNELTGRADMRGKRYLVEMHEQGMPVIPTVFPDRVTDLPSADEYVVKPLHGADSAGLEFVPPAALAAIDEDDLLVQPRIDMLAEISFLFVDDEFQYALTTCRGRERWELAECDASPADLDFARGMVAWNDIRHGIQRVDACRTEEGELLLVELEDLNPYLSLDLVSPPTRERFVSAFARALERVTA